MADTIEASYSHRMNGTNTVEAVVGPDHRIKLQLPTDLPEGPVKLTYSVEYLDEPTRKLSPQEFLHSEFFGMWADRDDLPSTNEEFLAWRRRLQERPYE